MTDNLQELLRSDLPALIVAVLVLFVGLVALLGTAVRRRARQQMSLWFGIFATLYGARLLADTALFRDMFAPGPQFWRYLVATITYVIPLPAIIFWRNLSGELRGGANRRNLLEVFLRAIVLVQTAFSLIAVVTEIVTRRPEVLMPVNNLLVIFGVVGAAIAVGVQGVFAANFPGRKVLIAGSALLALTAFYVNASPFLGLGHPTLLEPLGFFTLICCLGYVVLQRAVTSETRLTEIVRELAIAREIQSSILPEKSPRIDGLDITAHYLPMTDVAGDFYDFIQIDDRRLGILVADVTGHGVPAALIASMIKVALHALAAHAANPSELMSGLNNLLSGQLRGQFVTAGYVYLDLETRTGSYAGAGHPPLLAWRAERGELQPIDSNGLIIGVMKHQPYPSEEFQLGTRDRLLLYTDGLVEPANAADEEFGDRRIKEVFREQRSETGARFATGLLEELRKWAGLKAGASQADDITLVVVDVM